MYQPARTIISQYASAPILNALIGAWNAALDPSSFIEGFYTNWWNLNTAFGAGLDNLGSILGVRRSVVLPGTSGAAFQMTDATYRPVLFAKALANISRASASALNAIAQMALGAGVMYTADMGNMQMAYVFASAPTALQQGIAQNSGVLPQPQGVSVSYYTALLSNAQLAAAGTTDIGYVSGTAGTLTPSVDANGHTVTALYYAPATPSFVLSISSGTTLTKAYLNWLLVNGKPLSGAAATFSSSGGVYTWTWTGSGLPVMASGSTYTALLM